MVVSPSRPRGDQRTMNEEKHMIGNKYADCFCETCKEKIADATAKLSKLDLLRPKKMAARFRKLCCKDCEKKVLGKMRK